jgi:hypothetical protein
MEGMAFRTTLGRSAILIASAARRALSSGTPTIKVGYTVPKAKMKFDIPFALFGICVGVAFDAIRTSACELRLASRFGCINILSVG